MEAAESDKRLTGAQFKVMATVRSRRGKEMRLMPNKSWVKWWLQVEPDGECPKLTKAHVCSWISSLCVGT